MLRDGKIVERLRGGRVGPVVETPLKRYGLPVQLDGPVHLAALAGETAD